MHPIWVRCVEQARLCILGCTAIWEGPFFVCSMEGSEPWGVWNVRVVLFCGKLECLVKVCMLLVLRYNISK